MQALHPIWDPGWLIGMLIGGGIGALLLVTALFSAVMWRRSHDDLSGWAISAMAAGALGVLAAIIIGVISFPWSGQYHRYVPVTGTVTGKSSRFLAGDNGGTNQKFVLIVDGKPYGCNDTRCSLVKPGDSVALMCERAWQWSGIPGWDCNFVSDRRH